jgi:hypothetical protein
MNVDRRESTAGPGLGAPRGRSPREPAAVRLVSVALLAVAATIGGTLVVTGAVLPDLGPLALLALIAALCINRGVFFPSEQAATAEAAVLLAAVTAFAGHGAWLGPLAIALLVGPLDVAHWERRSYLRMAYNAGNRGLAVLAATGAFLVVRHAAVGIPGSSRSVVIDAIAALAGACAFAAVDVILSSTLLAAQGEPGRSAVRQVLSIDRLTVPLALVGAAAGFLAVGTGWWSIALVLVPVAFVPERVIVRTAPARRGVGRRAAWAASAGTAGGCALWLLLPGTGLASGVALVAVAVLVGLELEVDARCAVPPLLAVVVVAALVILRGDAAWTTALVATIAGTVASWSLAPTWSRRQVLVASAIAAVATGTAVAIAQLAGSSITAPVAVLAAATGFSLVVLSSGSGRRTGIVAFGWSSPLVAVAFAMACVWRTLGLGGAVVFSVWLAGTALAAASWGSLPWKGRVLSRLSQRVLLRSHRAVLVVGAIASATVAVVALACRAGDARAATAWFAVALGESVATATSFGVRQWRLAPRSRAVAATATGVAALVVAASGPAIADGHRWSVVLVVAAVAVLVGAGWRPSRCVDATRDPLRPGRAR